MKTTSLFLFLLINFSIVSGQENSTDKIALNQVVIEFEQAIINKDSVRFQKLFFSNSVPFVGIMSENTEMSIKKDFPDFQGISVSNADFFIREICKTEKDQAEKFYNIKIESSGPIASISFDYSFNMEDNMIQWGNEKWNLVFVENMWLITDVIYSIHFPGIEPFPYSN